MKILIDNGHGNDTPGKHSPDSSFFEFQFNREISKHICQRLKNWGFDAELIVPEIEDISLKERVNRVNAICKQFPDTILISIHANAAGNTSFWMNGRGWSAYTSKGKTKSDEIANYLYAAAEDVLAGTGMKIRKDFSDGDADWEENFYILKNTICPAVLTENFFYDNKEDLKFLQSTIGKEKIIQIHTMGIFNYINSLL